MTPSATGVPEFGVPSARLPRACRTARADGPTFLDLLWVRAPFSTQGAFLDAARVLADDTWLSRGLFSRAERDEVVAAAVRANLSC